MGNEKGQGEFMPELMHYRCSTAMKRKINEYCERNDITVAQFGRWSDRYFIDKFPKTPPVITEEDADGTS